LKKYIAVVLLILLIGFVWISNTSKEKVEELQPAETTLPENIAKEIPNLYIEEHEGTEPYFYVFDPEEYETSDEVYILIAIGDIKMDIRIDKNNNVVYLIPLYYPKIYQEYIVWESKDFGDNPENPEYKFTMHRIKVENASEYEYEFVLAEDPRVEFSQRVKEPGDVGARMASDLPKPMKKR